MELNMEIYVQKLGSQSPISEQQVLQMLNIGQLLTEDLACVKGMQEWLPLWQLPEIPPIVKDVFKMELQFKILRLNLQTWQDYEDNLLFRKQFEKDLVAWEETVEEFGSKYPNQPLGINGRIYLYYYQALLKIKSNAFMRFDDEDNPITGAIVLAQEENANEAIELFNKALELKNSSQFHLLKFEPLLYLREFDEIANITDYVLENFADDEAACIEAVRQKEMIENVIY
jgi:tetratricopeptide (TPR) repeat protein